MEETDKEVSMNLDVPIENDLDNLISEISDYQEALVYSLITSKKYSVTYDSKIFPECDQIVDDSNKVEEMPAESCKKSSGATVFKAEFSVEESKTSTSDSDEDEFLDPNSQIFTSAFTFSISDHTKLISHLKNLESEVDAFCCTSDEPLRRFQGIMKQLNYLGDDLEDSNSERSRNAAIIPSIELSDNNPNKAKVSKSLDSDSNICDSAFNSPRSESEISLSDIELHDSDQYSQVIKNAISVESLTNGQNSSCNNQETSVNSHEILKNEESMNRKNADDVCNRLEAFVLSTDIKSAFKKYYSDSNPTQSTSLTLSDSFPNSNYINDNEAPIAVSKSVDPDTLLKYLEEIKEIAEKSIMDHTSNSDRRTSIENDEETEIDPDSPSDIFKTVIKYHPIKKFEIPPYDSADTVRTLAADISLDSSIQNTNNGMPIFESKDLKKRLVDTFSNIDSDRIMVFEDEDCFSQNSSIICEDLLKDYLNIAAKLNFLFIKRIKDISAEKYELRMRSLRSLDDELGCFCAKLITTRNDWIKQFNEINENIAQSRIGSRGLYHMGTLRICMELVSILLDCSLEKQLKIEEYEYALVFHHEESK